MNIYSNSFFHRMPDEKILELILKEGFKVFYCLEEVFLGKKVESGRIGIPMVSFCDIPLVHLANNNYGKCGLGMSRQWGRDKHLEPVLYYPNDVRCQSTKMIINAYKEFCNSPVNSDSYRILGYAKPLKKPTSEKGEKSDNYIEREWRKVYANPSPHRWLNEAEYKLYRGDKDKVDKKPIKGTLKFSVKDIDFILVDKKSVSKLCNFIVNSLQNLCDSDKQISDDERFELLSKVIAYEDLIHNI